MKGTRTPRRLTDSEFERIFKEVRADINELQLHNTVLRGVLEELAKYPQLRINFPAFFGAFLAVMRTDMVIRLGRIYDPEGTGHDSCTLIRCLSALRDNLQFFTNATVEARLPQGYRDANRDFLLSHRINPKQVETDISTIKTNREGLIKLRHKLYAHKDVETVLSGKRDDFLSSHEEITRLIDLAHEIWNRYSYIWNASTYSAKTIGEGDYKWVFKYLRRGMKIQNVLDERQTHRLFARARLQARSASNTLSIPRRRFLGDGF